MGLYVNLRAAVNKIRAIKKGDWVELMNISDYQLWDVNRNVYPARPAQMFLGQKYRVGNVYEFEGKRKVIYLKGWSDTLSFTEDQLRKV